MVDGISFRSSGFLGTTTPYDSHVADARYWVGLVGGGVACACTLHIRIIPSNNWGTFAGEMKCGSMDLDFS